MTKTWPTGVETMHLIRQEAETVLLAFSAGKDSLLAWLEMREVFPRIVPVYKYLVPGLEFVEESLAYYERWFGVHILRVPHPSLFRWLNNYTFVPPECWQLIQRAGLPRPTHEDARDLAASRAGLPAGTWIAVGTRACDSPMRRMAFNRYGPVNENLRSFYPVWDRNKAVLVETIRAAGVKLPREYRIFGRSFDGLDFRFLYGIRKYFPRDYRRILDWFPMCEVELFRHEAKTKRRLLAQRHGGQSGHPDGRPEPGRSLPVPGR